MTRERRWALALALASFLLLLAGAVQAASGLYLLLKTTNDVTSATHVIAGLWATLVGVVSGALCVAGPRSRWCRSLVQLVLLCSVPPASAAAGVVTSLVPADTSAQMPAVVTVGWLVAGASLAAAVIAFVAANIAFGMQLLVPAYGPPRRGASSPKSGASDVYNVRLATLEMQQKDPGLQLDVPHVGAQAAWVYRSQSNSSTTPLETRLDAPPVQQSPELPKFTDVQCRKTEDEGSSCYSFQVHRAASDVRLCATAVPTPTSASRDPSPPRQVPRCVSLLSTVYTERQNQWAPMTRHSKSTSVLQVPGPKISEAALTRVSTRQTTSDCLRTPGGGVRGEDEPPSPMLHVGIREEPDEVRTPKRPSHQFPPPPVALDSSPVQTPLPASHDGGAAHPLAGTIEKLTSALSRLRSEPDYRLSRELDEVLHVLQNLECSPNDGCLTSTHRHAPREDARPASSASNASSSGYGSPEDASRECRPRQEAVAVRAAILEEDVHENVSNDGGDDAVFVPERREVDVGRIDGKPRNKSYGAYDEVDGVTATGNQIQNEESIIRTKNRDPTTRTDLNDADCAVVTSGQERRESDVYRRRSVVQLVSMLERSAPNSSTRHRRPTVPPPPPPSEPPPPACVPPPAAYVPPPPPPQLPSEPPPLACVPPPPACVPPPPACVPSPVPLPPSAVPVSPRTTSGHYASVKAQPISSDANFGQQSRLLESEC